MEKNNHAEILKQLLRKYNWEIDICENVEIKDSEILLKVIKRNRTYMNRIVPEKHSHTGLTDSYKC